MRIGKCIKTLIRFWSYKIYNEKINIRRHMEPNNIQIIYTDSISQDTDQHIDIYISVYRYQYIFIHRYQHILIYRLINYSFKHKLLFYI